VSSKTQHWKAQLARVLLLSLLAAITACSGAGARTTGTATNPRRGYEGPELELPRLDGGSWRLSDEAGRVVVLHFFATFDGPSQALVTIVEQTHIVYSPRGVSVIGIAMDPGTGRNRQTVVDAYCSLSNLTFDVMLASEELATGQTDIGRVPAVPTTAVLDQRGRPYATFEGIFRGEQLTAVLESLL